jgi:membrane protein YqaA with SNARE-associated domain
LAHIDNLTRERLSSSLVDKKVSINGGKTAIHRIFIGLVHLGGAGLFLLGVCDSSFLFLPLGNDLLLTALTVQHHNKLPIYVAMASGGSATGVLILDFIVRKGGEKGLHKLMSARRFEFLKRKMTARASIPILLACLAPPPFPFTPVVATASVFNYPRTRLLLVVFFGRVVRFTLIGLLAIHFGHALLRLSRTSAFLGIMVAIIVISVIGSILSILRWLRQSKKASEPSAA